MYRQHLFSSDNIDLLELNEMIMRYSPLQIDDGKTQYLTYLYTVNFVL